MEPILAMVLIVVALILGCVIGVIVGMALRKKVGESKIGSAEQEAKRIVDEAAKEAETTKKNAILEAKEQILKERNA